MKLIKVLILVQISIQAAKTIHVQRRNQRKPRITLKQVEHKHLVMGLSNRWKARNRRHNKFVV